MQGPLGKLRCEGYELGQRTGDTGVIDAMVEQLPRGLQVVGERMYDDVELLLRAELQDARGYDCEVAGSCRDLHLLS